MAASGTARTYRRAAAGLVVMAGLLPALAAGQTLRPEFWGTHGSVNAVTSTEDAVYIGGSFWAVEPETGGGVPLSTLAGVPAPRFPKVDGDVYAAIDDGEGGWFITGSFINVAGLPRANIAHILVNGAVADWNPGIRTPSGSPTGAYGWALARRGNALFVGGFFGMAGSDLRANLAAFDATTGATLPWDPQPTGFVDALHVHDNTMYVGGKFYRIAGEVRSYVAAFDADSFALRAWNPTASSAVLAIAARDSVVFLGGEFTSVDLVPRQHLAAIDASSGALLPWDPGADGDVRCLATAGATLFAGGDFRAIAGVPRRSLAEIDAATGAVSAFDPQTSFPGVASIGLDAHALYVIGGLVAAALDIESGRTLWATPLDRSGATIAVATPHEVSPAAAAARDRPGPPSIPRLVYVGGDFATLSQGLPRVDLAAFDLRTGRPTDWAPRADAPVDALALAADRIWIGGQFGTIDGAPHPWLVATDPRTGASWSDCPQPNGYVLALLPRGDTLYVAGAFTKLGDLARSHLAAVDARTGRVLEWNPATNDVVSSLAFANGTLYVGGQFTMAGAEGAATQSRARVAAFDASTGALLAWDPSTDGPVNALTVTEGRVFLGGEFSYVGGMFHRPIAATDPESGAPLAWEPHVSRFNDHPAIRSLLAIGPSLLVGGVFNSIGGEWRANFAEVDALTAELHPWYPQLWGQAIALSRRDDHLFVGGQFYGAGGFPCYGVAVFRLDSAEPAGPPATAAPDPPGLEAAALTCTPNPAREVATLRWTLTRDAEVSIAVYDLAGRRVAEPVRSRRQSAGLHEVGLDTHGWRPGVYLGRIEVDGRVSVARLSVVR